MSKISEKEQENRKKAIFDSMGTRGQKAILKKGYDEWDPFEKPKDPIDIRKDVTRRTSQELVREFLRATSMENYSNEYGRAAFDFCNGIINKEEKYLAMFEFACWYKNQLEIEKKDIQ